MNKNNETKVYNYDFDFSLKINENMLVYREFNIRNYNDKFRESLEARELIYDLMGVGTSYPFGEFGIIPNIIKKNSVKYLWDMYNPYYAQSEKDSQYREDSGKLDKFTFEISKKINDNFREVILKGGFSGEQFQSKVRVKIDIKEELPGIIELIRNYMSRNNYTEFYAEKGPSKIKLSRTNILTEKELLVLNECK